MAENAANFTFTTQNKPSIFEVIASKSLNDTLHPALQKVALVRLFKCVAESRGVVFSYERPSEVQLVGQALRRGVPDFELRTTVRIFAQLW